MLCNDICKYARERFKEKIEHYGFYGAENFKNKIEDMYDEVIDEFYDKLSDIEHDIDYELENFDWAYHEKWAHEAEERDRRYEESRDVENDFYLTR